ncbi:MAG: hypothetical protein K2K86_03185 [Muribaculaceae bacterium]|nr:hypothetical protein [Muribaculaceae bacterium]
MPKITLTKDFVNNLLSLDADECTSVLQGCRQLLEADDDAIETLQLEPGTSQIVVDLHADMKRRIRASRRRRERREAAKAALKAATAASGTTAPTAEPRQSTYTTADYYRVVDAMLSGTPTLSGSQYVLLIKLARLILKHIGPDRTAEPDKTAAPDKTVRDKSVTTYNPPTSYRLPSRRKSVIRPKKLIRISC